MLVFVLHEADPHCVLAMSADGVVSKGAKFKPRNVTAAPPVVGKLNDVNVTAGESKLNKLERVPTSSVIVTLVDCVFPVPAGEEHVSDVDDDQATVTHWLRPKATLGVRYEAPRLKPVMVTEVAEVAAALKDAKYVGTGESYVNMFTPAPCAVPITELTANAIDLNGPEPAADEQSTCVFVVQLAVAQLVTSMYAVSVLSIIAKFEPLMVTIAMLSGPFGATMLVGTGASYVRKDTSVELMLDTVRSTLCGAPDPYELIMHVTWVVLNQLVVPQDESPSIMLCVVSDPAKFEPEMVNETPVDGGKFMFEH
jgi:hypothetical protein